MVSLKLSSIVWVRFRSSYKLDSESELLSWLLQDGLSMQSICFEIELQEISWFSFFGVEDDGRTERGVPFVRRLCHTFRLVAHNYLLSLGIKSCCFGRKSFSQSKQGILSLILANEYNK